MSETRFVRALCRRGCCPSVAIDLSPGALWPVVLREAGGGVRERAELCLTREEALELARALDEAGLVALARDTRGA